MILKIDECEFEMKNNFISYNWDIVENVNSFVVKQGKQDCILQIRLE